MHRATSHRDPSARPPRADGPQGHVLIVLHEDVVGGATRSLLRLIPHLAERGWAFSFWASKPSALHDELVESGHDVDGLPRHVGFSVRWLRLPPGVRRKLRSMPPWFRGLVRRIDEVGPDIVHANSVFSLPEALVARATRTPTVLHSHEMIPVRKGALVPPLLRLAGITPIGASRACARRVSGRWARAAVVYETSPLPPRPDEPAIAAGKLVIGSIGEISRRKGSDVFVAAAERLLASRADVAVKLVGRPDPGRDRGWAEQVIERAKATGIEYTPSVDVFAELPGWDLLLAPSRHDPFPLVVLEAMASMVPVIGSEVDGIVEQITPGAGCLVPPEEPDALAAAASVLLDDPEARALMGEAGRARVAENFTPALQAPRLAEIYRRVAAARRPPER